MERGSRVEAQYYYYSRFLCDRARQCVRARALCVLVRTYVRAFACMRWPRRQLLLLLFVLPPRLSAVVVCVRERVPIVYVCDRERVCVCSKTAKGDIMERKNKLTTATTTNQYLLHTIIVIRPPSNFIF